MIIRKYVKYTVYVDKVITKVTTNSSNLSLWLPRNHYFKRKNGYHLHPSL